MSQHPISIFRSIIRQVVAYGRLKSKGNFKLLALKVVAVAYERWSLTRGSKYSGLTGKPLVYWKTGRLREVVATGEVRLYLFLRLGLRSTVTRHENSEKFEKNELDNFRFTVDREHFGKGAFRNKDFSVIMVFHCPSSSNTNAK